MKSKANGKLYSLGANSRTATSEGSSHHAVRTKRLYTATEAATYLGYRTAWGIRELAWQGALPVVRLGKRRIAFDVQDLDDFVEARKTVEHLH